MVRHKKHTSGLGSRTTQQLLDFVWPSWNGACAYLYISLAIVAALVAVSHFDGNLLSQHLNTWNTAIERSSSSDPYGMYPDSPSALENGIDVVMNIVLWGSAAAVLYFFIAGVLHAARRPAGLIHPRKDAHLRPFHMAATVFAHVFIRGLALCMLLVGAVVWVKVISKYVLAATYLAGNGTSQLEASGAIVLSLMLLIAGMHMLVVLCRLFLFKPRLFGPGVPNH